MLGISFTYLSRNIVTAIHFINDNVVGGIFTIDIDKSIAAHVSLSGTAKDCIDITSTYGDFSIPVSVTLITATIDVAANNNLGLHRRGSEEHQQTYYDISNSQLSILN